MKRKFNTFGFSDKEVESVLEYVLHNCPISELKKHKSKNEILTERIFEQKLKHAQTIQEQIAVGFHYRDNLQWFLSKCDDVRVHLGLLRKLINDPSSAAAYLLDNSDKIEEYTIELSFFEAQYPNWQNIILHPKVQVAKGETAWIGIVEYIGKRCDGLPNWESNPCQIYWNNLLTGLLLKYDLSQIWSWKVAKTAIAKLSSFHTFITLLAPHFPGESGRNVCKSALESICENYAHTVGIFKTLPTSLQRQIKYVFLLHLRYKTIIVKGLVPKIIEYVIAAHML